MMGFFTDIIDNPSLFFDRFGLVIFGFLTGEAIYKLFIKKVQAGRGFEWARLIIGILGLIVDGTFVIMQDFMGKTLSIFGL